MQLTVNQMMALFAIARGTFENELLSGTKSQDLRKLGQGGLIVRQVSSTSTYSLTAKGDSLVEALKKIGGAFAANRSVTVSESPDALDFEFESRRQSMMIPARLPNCRSALVPADRDFLSGFPTMSHGSFEVEQDDGKGLQLSDVQDGAGRVNGGAFFLVADATVKLEEPTEGSDAEFKSIQLQTVDLTVHATEQQATDVATDRAKAQVGSRHVVLKAVAMHEVAVPIKSTRL